MIQPASAEARQQGFREMRLATGNPGAVQLFESEGFRQLLDVRWWRGMRVEGGDPARMPDPDEAKRIWPSIASSRGIELYAGIPPHFTPPPHPPPAHLQPST